MKIDATEIQHLAQAAAAPRFDLYTAIHKAARVMMGDTLACLGRMDADDALDLARGTERVLELLEFCRSHLAHENDFVHPAIEARSAGASERIAHEHVEHVAHIEQLAGAVARLRAAPADTRGALQQALYAELALFIAENFVHMRYEETVHNALLWQHYTDPELLEIHDALLASIPPEEMMVVIRWLGPSLHPGERAALFADMKAKAPAPAFDAAVAVVRPHLVEGEWTKLALALGLAA